MCIKITQIPKWHLNNAFVQQSKSQKQTLEEKSADADIWESRTTGIFHGKCLSK